MRRFFGLILGLLVASTVAADTRYAPIIHEHDTDCTSVSDSYSKDFCYEKDSQNFYKCVPTTSRGQCDTVAEWKLVGAASDGGFVTAANVSYLETNVAAVLDELLYVAPNITSFTNDHGDVENGTEITSTVLNWIINKAVTSVTINNGIGSLSVDDTNYTHTSTYSTNRTYQITVSDGTNEDVATTSITFKNSNYWGVSANTSLSSSQINALTNALATSKSQTRTFTPDEQYIYIAYPASYGTATFTVNGLVNNAFILLPQSHTNASGATVPYNVYRSNNLLTGTYTVVVQ